MSTQATAFLGCNGVCLALETVIIYIGHGVVHIYTLGLAAELKAQYNILMAKTHMAVQPALLNKHQVMGALEPNPAQDTDAVPRCSLKLDGNLISEGA